MVNISEYLWTIKGPACGYIYEGEMLLLRKLPKSARKTDIQLISHVLAFSDFSKIQKDNLSGAIGILDLMSGANILVCYTR